MKKLVVDSWTEKKLRKGVQLLDGKDFSDLPFNNQLAELVSKRGDLLGTAYLSPQQKGIGWLISRQRQVLDESYFEDLFQKARAKRQSLEQSERTTAYRLFNQDGDDFGGLTVDRYGDFALFSWYNAFVFSQKEMIIKAFRTVFPDLVGAYEKVRFRGQSYDSAHLYGQEAPPVFSILENGVSYQIFLNDGLMTGIFLDQRPVRQELINGLATGKRVLNLFSYTAAFSVAAAMGGAAETTSVDLAKRSLELSKAHFEANHLRTENHRFVVMDVFSYFKYARRHEQQFELIIIDPPSFARNKKQTFSVQKDYHKLIQEALTLLSPQGTLIASTNASNMTVEQFRKEIEKGFAAQKHHYSKLQQLPSDFAVNKHDERSNYLKVFTIKVK